jgi:hypothetical protein
LAAKGSDAPIIRANKAAKQIKYKPMASQILFLK